MVYEAPHHATLEALKNHANAGCALCQLFMQRISDQGVFKFDAASLQFWLRPKDQNLTAPDQDASITDLIYELEHPSAQAIFRGSPPEVWYEFFHEDFESSPFLTRKVATLPPLNTARAWVDDCVKHQQKRRHRELPTRLIDIGIHEGDPLRLISSSLESGTCEYVALSHCWGGYTDYAARTEKSNVEERRLGFDVASLEQTFKDAVTVTQALRYRYLWIDNICIAQDDEDDWERECAKMDAVFSSAAVTIAASDAPNAHAGFLQARSLQKRTRPYCEISTQGRLAGLRVQEGLYGRQHEEQRFVDGRGFLKRRAWCLQEEVLATCVLSFSKLQMSFSCLRCDKQEYHPWPHLSDRFKDATGTLNDALYSEPIKAKFANETGLLAYYAARRLSYRKDRLPAFSGLAKRFSSDLGDRYLAGLWYSDLGRGLSWVSRDDPSAGGCGSLEYIAPSGSWASNETGVDYHYREAFTSLIEVMSASTTLTGHDPFGQVSGSEISLRTWMNALILHLKHLYVWSWDVQPEDKEWESGIARGHFDRQPGKLEKHHSQDVTLTCMVLGMTESRELIKICHALILELVKLTSLTYRRIGKLTHYSVILEGNTPWDRIMEGAEFKEIRLI